MPKFKGPRAPARRPTPYAELNSVLSDLVSGAQAVLGGDFVGAYLQGSFAVGDFDEASDVDFVVAMKRDVTPTQLSGLAALHDRLHDGESFWSRRLEGAYFPVAELRRHVAEPREPPGEPPRGPDWIDPGTGLVGPNVYPTLFLDHGSRDLQRSEHDNTCVVRWILRERGIVLAGPDPRALLEPVTAQALRAEVRRIIRAKAPVWVDEGYVIDRNWLWAFFVTLGCRMLQTLETGEVRSKKAATAWGLSRLDPRWAELIQAAYAMGRDTIAVRIEPAPPERADQAKAFLRQVMSIEAATPEASAADKAREVLARRLEERRGAPGTPGRQLPPRGPGGRGPRGAPPAPIRPGGRGRRG